MFHGEPFHLFWFGSARSSAACRRVPLTVAALVSSVHYLEIVERRSLVVYANANPWTSLDIQSLDRLMPGRKHNPVPLHIKPDRDYVRTPIFAYRRDFSCSRAVTEETLAFVLRHLLYMLPPLSGSAFFCSRWRYPTCTASIDTEPPSIPSTGKVTISLCRLAPITYSSGR